MDHPYADGFSHQGWNKVYHIGVWFNARLFCRAITGKGSMMIKAWRRMHIAKTTLHMRIRKINTSKIGWGFRNKYFQGWRWGLDQTWRENFTLMMNKGRKASSRHEHGGFHIRKSGTTSRNFSIQVRQGRIYFKIPRSEKFSKHEGTVHGIP